MESVQLGDEIGIVRGEFHRGDNRSQMLPELGMPDLLRQTCGADGPFFILRRLLFQFFKKSLAPPANKQYRWSGRQSTEAGTEDSQADTLGRGAGTFVRSSRREKL